jgi:PadR family transcriptional regulator, regulatory protein PadR
MNYLLYRVGATRSSNAPAGRFRAFAAEFPLDNQLDNEQTIVLEASTRVSSESKSRIQVLQGTLDLIVLRTLRSMGPQHAYGIAARLQQVSEDLLKLNQGTLYPALVRLEQQGWIKGKWDKTENGREAKYYDITKAGLKALEEQTQRWRQLSGLVEKLLAEES